MKRNKKIIIIIVFCVITFLLITTMFLYKRIEKERTQTGKPLTPLVDPKEDDVLNISGFGVFFDKYDGDLKSSTIASYLEQITTVDLPKLFNEVKNYDEGDLEIYYNSNSDFIKQMLGIEDVSTFKQFVKNIKHRNIDLNNWYRLDLLKETFVNNTDKTNYAYIEYEVSFKNNEKIKYSLYVTKKENIKPAYIINIIK